MPPADPAAKAVEAWAMIPPSGELCLGWIFRTKQQADWLKRAEYPGRTKARVAKIRITEITPQHGGDDE